MTTNYKYITEVTKFDGLGRDILGLDIETSGLNPRNDSITVIQISDGRTTYIFDARMLPKRYIQQVLEYYNDRTFIIHNAKFDLAFLMHNYDWFPNNVHDTMLCEAVICAGFRNSFIGLSELTLKYFGWELDKEQQSSWLVPSLKLTKEQLEYAAKDAEILPSLYEIQKEQLSEFHLTTIADMENRLVPIITQMELDGIKLEPDRLVPVVDKMEQEAEEFYKKLVAIAGKEFNPRSPKQVKEIFHELSVRTNRKDLAVDSTAKTTIQFIKHPFPQTLLNYRERQKVVSSFGSNLIEHVEDDGRIHSQFNQMGASTGRFSSSRPNLQNIPHTKEFRHPFVAGEGFKFVTADYSQIELRLAGYLSNETSILEEYKKESADLHRLTASKIFKTDTVSPEQRMVGKTLNFSALYGISANGLVLRYNWKKSDAQKYLDGFWDGYPVLSAYMQSAGNFALRNGYSVNLLGRRRWFNLPSSIDPSYVGKVNNIRRAAGNFLIQGLAADIMKYAIIRVFNALKGRARIVLTVHDEVGVEVPEDAAEEYEKIIVREMEEAGRLIVRGGIPLKVNSILMDSWTK